MQLVTTMWFSIT